MNKTLFKQSILMLSFLFSVGFAFSQAPEKLSYQSVIRRTNNDLVVNQNVRVKISILQGTISGTAVYVEDHTTSTNSNGLVSLSIGGGNVISGSFSTINWENGPYFVKMEADPTGGSNYTVSGTSQLLSVPYALYAKTSGSSTPGPTGAQGIQGVAGVNGTNGTNGTNGVDGKNTLVKTTSEAAGANCTTGGVKMEYGLDANNNGTLDVSEVNATLTKYVCNGTSSTSSLSQGVKIGFSSSTTWTCPAGVTQITVELWGASGAPGYNCGKYFGGYSSSAPYGLNLGGNGGNGGYIKSPVTVIPGQIYIINIGIAGMPGTMNPSQPNYNCGSYMYYNVYGGQNGGNGGSSSFNGNLIVAGGQGGTSATTSSNGVNGTNGDVSGFVTNNTPTIPSYIPSNYLTPFPTGVAQGAQRTTICNSQGSYLSSGQNGFCIISY